jgi:Flp pilus assembly pilin Flp
MKTIQLLWADQSGVIVSAELILIATILVIGMVVGLTTIRDQVVQELGDVAQAIANVNQSYSLSGVTGHHSSTAGSFFIDQLDDCDTNIDPAGAEPVCIEICGIPATNEGCNGVNVAVNGFIR